MGDGSLWNGSVWEINNHLAAIKSVSCCKLEDKPSDICVPAGCAEGQYWCNAENTCKPAGQSCTAACTASSAPVSWTQYNNPSPSNINSPGAPSLGTASGSIQVDGKTIQVNYAGDVRSVGIASNWSWVWTGNTVPFLSTLVPNIPDPANLL